jgi:ribonuclease HII
VKYIIGIDEVGRGPLAGPVTVCALAIKKSDHSKVRKLTMGVKDSKKLSHEERVEWLSLIQYLEKQKLLSFSIGSVSNLIIDKNGIASAIKLALKKAITNLKIDPNNCKVLLDGSLYAPVEYKNQKTIIKGDEKEFIISLASIVAKVHRDLYMIKAAKKYPGYGFEIHKGYGTQDHLKTIKKNGISPFHRTYFCKAA